MKALYRLAIGYFALMGLLLLLSGAALALLKGGLTPQSVLAYYAPKSATGLLKTAQPHFLGIGIFIMVTLHFFLFIPARRPGLFHIGILYATALLMIAIPFALSEGAWLAALLKLIVTLVFIFLVLERIWQLLRAANR